jgi:hypothetical protein
LFGEKVGEVSAQPPHCGLWKEQRWCATALPPTTSGFPSSAAGDAEEYSLSAARGSDFPGCNGTPLAPGDVVDHLVPDPVVPELGGAGLTVVAAETGGDCSALEVGACSCS